MFLGDRLFPGGLPPAPPGTSGAELWQRRSELVHQQLADHPGFTEAGKQKLGTTMDRVIEALQQWEKTRGITVEEAQKTPDVYDELARFVHERTDGIDPVTEDQINFGWFETQGISRADIANIQSVSAAEKARLMDVGSSPDTQREQQYKYPAQDFTPKTSALDLDRVIEGDMEERAHLAEKMAAENPNMSPADIEATVNETVDKKTDLWAEQLHRAHGDDVVHALRDRSPGP